MAEEQKVEEFKIEVTGYTPPHPSIYHAVFGTNEGGVVLEHLQAIFYDRPSYVAGGIEAERETLRRAAHREVIGFIHRMIAKGRTG